MKYLMALLMLLVLSGTASARPTLFFTDITSGPNAGGEGGNGVYVTIYGNNLGTSPTVTWNGLSCVNVITVSGRQVNTWFWYQKVTVQLTSGCAAATGNFILTTGGNSSNGASFTVRSGNIYCVATTGVDTAGHGTFSSGCYASIPYAAETAMVAGDITYVRNGVVASGDNGFSSPLNLSGINGTAGNPFALVAYPGATATIGGTGLTRGIIQFPSISTFWTLAGFTLNFPSSGEAIHLYEGSGHWDIIGNSITCPTGDGFTGCVTTDGAPFINFWGNTIHDTGAVGADKTYHAFYFGDHGTTGNQAIDVGWNDVHNIHGCRGIMFHSIDSTPGAEGYNLRIHDNLVHDTQCDGIALANVNPNKGAILVYNNLLYHVGTGPDPQGIGANYSCIYAGDSNGNPTTPVEVYNNTCYDGGSRGVSEGDAGAYTAFIPIKLRNNVTYELSGEAYFTTTTSNSNMSNVTGSNNLWFGTGNGPTQTTGNVNLNPGFVSVGTNFHLALVGSPANAAGTATLTPVYDQDGLLRPAPPSIGAYEFAASAPQALNPKMSGTATMSGSAVMQ